MCARRSSLWLVALLLWLLFPAWPAAASEPPMSQQQAKAKLDEVRAHIEVLTRNQHQAEARRDAVNKTLVRQARALAQAAAELRASQQRLDELRAELATLERQRAAVQARLDGQQQALAELLRASYKLGHASDLRLLLGQVSRCQDGPSATDGCDAVQGALARIQRALAYSRYFRIDRERKIHALLQDLASKRELAARVVAQRHAIEAQRDQHKQRHASVQAERRKQQQLLASTEADIRKRGTRIEQLQQQRESLQQLLQRLHEVFADIPSSMPQEVPFGQRRGKLPWPVDGGVIEADGGILISAASGSRVRAVAHGRVAYADWLRGYGMLVIIDHGDGWMSLYGDNESLVRAVGEWVSAGDVLATSGHGVNRPTGLYFALRHDGEPVDAKAWLAPR